LACIGIISVLTLSPWILRGLGYYVDNPGWEVGRIAANHKNIELCEKIFVYTHIFGPTRSERRRECIFEYASITHNPSACNLLLPSEYGMSCIGDAVDFPQQECISTRPPELLCYIPEKDIQSSYDVPQIDDCTSYKKYNNHQVIHWCFGERANKFGELDQCLTDASKDLEKDDCYYQRAMKLDDLRLDLCEKIQSNQLMRTDCTETIKAWLKFPQLKPNKVL
jgi:hypothetical protein